VLFYVFCWFPITQPGRVILCYFMFSIGLRLRNLERYFLCYLIILMSSVGLQLRNLERYFLCYLIILMFSVSLRLRNLGG